MDLSSKSKSNLLTILRMSGGFVNAMDGLWFEAVEETHGKAEAVKLAIRVLERYTHVLVKNRKKNLGLSGSSIEMMRQVIETDPSFLANDYEISHLSRDRMFLRVNRCVILEAMEGSWREEYMCEETTGFYFRNIAREIGADITVHMMRTPLRNTPDEVCCEWLFEARPRSSDEQVYCKCKGQVTGIHDCHKHPVKSQALKGRAPSLARATERNRSPASSPKPKGRSVSSTCSDEIVKKY